MSCSRSCQCEDVAETTHSLPSTLLSSLVVEIIPIRQEPRLGLSVLQLSLVYRTVVSCKPVSSLQGVSFASIQPGIPRPQRDAPDMLHDPLCWISSRLDVLKPRPHAYANAGTRARDGAEASVELTSRDGGMRVHARRCQGTLIGPRIPSHRAAPAVIWIDPLYGFPDQWW